MECYFRVLSEARYLRLIALTCIAFPLASCGGTSSTILNLGVIDSPIDSASAVVIAFTGVELKPSGNAKAIIFNFSTPKSIDLLKEQNGHEAQLLSGASVPPGNYDWMALLVNVGSGGMLANSYIEINGAQFPLSLPMTVSVSPSTQRSLPVGQRFTLSANQIANLTIDLNLEQELTLTASQTYFLDSATSRLINNADAGTISGTVALTTLQSNSVCLQKASLGAGALPNAHVYVFTGTVTPSSSLTPLVEPEITTSSSGEYTYDQPFLPAGTYTAAIACTSTSNTSANTVAAFIPTGGMTATVTANQTTVADF